MGNYMSRKLVSVRWDICCSPLEEGGLNLKRLHLMNAATLSKVVCKLISKDSFPFEFLYSHFMYKNKVI